MKETKLYMKKHKASGIYNNNNHINKYQSIVVAEVDKGKGEFQPVK